LHVLPTCIFSVGLSFASHAFPVAPVRRGSTQNNRSLLDERRVNRQLSTRSLCWQRRRA